MLRPCAIHNLCCLSSLIPELLRTRSMLRAFTCQIFNGLIPVQSFLSFPFHSTRCLCGTAAFPTPSLTRALSCLHSAAIHMQLQWRQQGLFKPQGKQNYLFTICLLLSTLATVSPTTELGHLTCNQWNMGRSDTH